VELISLIGKLPILIINATNRGWPLEEDARVVVTYRNQEEFAALRSTDGAAGSSLEGHRVDVTEEAATAQFIDRVLAEHGRLDAMVNTWAATPAA
jgi:NAD(P)-dependent dehydrogenase (short-subunit alcohol dehydrogenase family)